MVSKEIDWEKFKKEIVEEHNLLRKNPQSYIKILEDLKPKFQGNKFIEPGKVTIITNEGYEAVKEAIDFLKTCKPIGELKLNEGICKASNDHVNDIGPKGLLDHKGTDGSNSTARIERYVDWNITLAENIDFGSHTGRQVITSLLIDDGVSNRGHRKNLMNPKLKEFGVGVGYHKEYETCIVIDYVGEVLVKSESKTETGKKPVTKNNVADKLNNLANKFENKVNIIESDDPFKDDPDAPENAISCEISTETKTCGKKTTITTTKTYETSKNETITVTNVQEITKG